jgi:hypothetical protein
VAHQVSLPLGCLTARRQTGVARLLRRGLRRRTCLLLGHATLLCRLRGHRGLSCAPRSTYRPAAFLGTQARPLRRPKAPLLTGHVPAALSTAFSRRRHRLKQIGSILFLNSLPGRQPRLVGPTTPHQQRLPAITLVLHRGSTRALPYHQDQPTRPSRMRPAKQLARQHDSALPVHYLLRYYRNVSLDKINFIQRF